MSTIVTYIPSKSLKDFISSIVYLEDLGTGVALQRVYQTIVINLGDNFFKSDLYSGKLPKENHAVIWINGQHQHPFTIENPGRTRMYVIGVMPGMLPYFSSIPVAETNEKGLSAEHWAGPDLFVLRAQLLTCEDVQEGFKLIEEYLIGQLPSNDFKRVLKIQYINEAIPVKTVAEICSALSCTRKKLRADTIHYFGAPVKFMQGIIRFDKHLVSISRDPQKSLSSLHTFYDQAHFINDFKFRTGITPRQYRALCQYYPNIKYTPNFLPLSRETFLQFIAGYAG